MGVFLTRAIDCAPSQSFGGLVRLCASIVQFLRFLCVLLSLRLLSMSLFSSWCAPLLDFGRSAFVRRMTCTYVCSCALLQQTCPYPLFLYPLCCTTPHPPWLGAAAPVQHAVGRPVTCPRASRLWSRNRLRVCRQCWLSLALGAAVWTCRRGVRRGPLGMPPLPPSVEAVLADTGTCGQPEWGRLTVIRPLYWVPMVTRPFVVSMCRSLDRQMFALLSLSSETMPAFDSRTVMHTQSIQVFAHNEEVQARKDVLCDLLLCN